LIAGAGQAYGQQQAGKFNASTMSFNAKMAELNATDARQRGDAAVGSEEVRLRQTQGAARAAAGGAGVDVAAGTSASDVLLNNQTTGMQDMAIIRSNAIKAAFGFQAEAGDDRLKAAVTERTANNEAFGTLATAGYKATKAWQKMRGVPAVASIGGGDSSGAWMNANGEQG
jgi:hypothetical protein